MMNKLKQLLAVATLAVGTAFGKKTATATSSEQHKPDVANTTLANQPQTPQTSPPPSPLPPHSDVENPTEPNAKPKGKHWTKSKTMWFNIVVTTLGVATSILPYAEPFLTPQIFGVLTAVIGAGNMILRSITKEAITGNNSPVKEG